MLNNGWKPNQKTMMKKHFLALFVLPMLFLAGVYQCAIAADIFDLSYSLTEGGYQLNFTQSSLSKGLKVEINSNIATRYEVTQKLLSPLQNRDQPNLTIRDNFVYRGVRGSNKFGDFRASGNDSPVRLDEVLYVSNATGASDSFTMIFGINNIEDIEPGYYSGRLALVLTPIGSTRSQILKVVDVYLTISEGPASKPRIEITTPTGSKTVRLNPKKESMQSAEVVVKINGKFRKRFSIIQLLNQPFESEEGTRLDNELINVAVKEARKGNAAGGLTCLSLGPQTLYTSAADGSADDYFVIAYSLGDIAKERAGTYRGKIQFILQEIGGIQAKLETLDFEINHERIFDISITPSDQKYSIEFNNVKPTEPPKQSEVTIEIITNIGRRYQVNQEIYSDLTNQEGKSIPPQYFTMRVDTLDTKGKVRVSGKQEVKKGSMVLFISDNQGSCDKFKVMYELESPKDLQAGNYSTRITYSLLEI